MEQKNRKIAKPVPNCLSIAGVDPSGGAGIFADIKAMSAAGVYAAGVVTALTAQNTKSVVGVLPISPEFVTEQLNTLFDDVCIDAVKIGMLSEPAVIEVVASALKQYQPKWVVLDPVMVAKSGDALLKPEALKTLLTDLLPLADIITPNLPEAGTLLGQKIEKREDMLQAAHQLFSFTSGKGGVLLKGGHLPDNEPALDLFYDGQQDFWLESPRIYTKNTHGTGCTLSSVLAAYLAKTDDVLKAVQLAKRYITAAIETADQLHVGSGHGPVHHFVDATSVFNQ